MSLLGNLLRSVWRSSRGAMDPETWLRTDHPRLIELEQRYASLGVPMAGRSQWSAPYVAAQIDLRNFRGETAYIWQRRDRNDDAKVALTHAYVKDLDRLGLRERLTEDAAFGVAVWTVEGRIVTRELLDSIVEIGFLDRHLGISKRSTRILDIGAGYGRLAHRLVQAFPGTVDVLCTDGIATSTFLSEFYLRYRKAGRQATVVPLDEIDAALARTPIDVAVNMHSFSECPASAVEGWLELLARHRVPHLMIVPNAMDNGGTRLLSVEADRSERDLMPLIAARGYKLVAAEPKYADPAVQAGGVSPTMHYLFALKG